jgi:competence protein ComEA
MLRILAAFLAAAFAFAAQAAVDANQANQAELETIKGIGPGLSGKILDARKTAPFKDWNDLVDRVGGVGPGNAARFSQAGLTVNNVAYHMPAGATAGEKTRSSAKGDKADKATKADTTPAKAPAR